MRQTLYRWTVLAGVVIAPFAAAGCGGAGSGPPAERAVHITERDFKITAPKVLAAGDYRFKVDNEGPDDHELIVVRKGAAPLPFRGDGITLDEDAFQHQEAGALEPQVPGTHELRVHLKPGHYVLFCNMSGHYLGGMDREVVVR